MLDFSLTDEQRLLEQSVREWAAREVAPHIREADRAHRFDRDRILGGMASLGLLGISVPQEYGGAGMDYICLGLASEELEYVDTSLRVIMSVHAGLNCLTLLAGDTGWFKMDDVEVPEDNLLGRVGEGFKIAMFALDQGRFTVAAGATGLIRACRDASVKYATERRAFGVEIGQHQLVKEMIAEMESDYQAARLLWLRAGWLKNMGRRNTRETGLAKWFATVASERAAGDAVQIHGANGYSDEYPVGRFFRNCKGAVIYEGTREIHKLMQADYVLGYRVDRPTRCELPAHEKN